MTKILRISFLYFILSSCAYEPILLKKNYNFNFNKINFEGNKDINKVIKENLIDVTNNISVNNFELYFNTKKEKKTISSNKKGDPAIYKINITLNYNLKKDGKILINNEIVKHATYNNIDDKFELLKFEENVLINLSEKLSQDILISTTSLLK